LEYEDPVGCSVMTVQIGDIAPEFSLMDAAGSPVSLADFRGRRVVLYFYPKDDTPGCTKEACAFRDRYDAFHGNQVVVLGVSPNDAKSHGKFIQKYSLPFPLLCDTENAVATAYGSYGLKKFMGREYMGVMRHTIVIDPGGRIERIYRKVKPETHAADLLADLLGPSLNASDNASGHNSGRDES
jgi:thioredoxin-dependent peroxiredoxin